MYLKATTSELVKNETKNMVLHKPHLCYTEIGYYNKWNKSEM